MKEYKKIMIITSVVTLLPILVGVMLWDRLPEQIATHFGMDGAPNGWTSKGFTVFGIPVFLTVMQWFGMTVTLQDPKKQNMSEKMLKIILWLIPCVSWLLTIACYGYELGYATSEPTWGYGIMGIMFLVIGNYLPKCRQNYTMGIKIPWTLHDEENWNHTHRMAGYLWIVTGFLLLGNIFLQQEWILVVAIIVATFVPMVYSYLYYLKHGKKKED